MIASPDPLKLCVRETCPSMSETPYLGPCRQASIVFKEEPFAIIGNFPYNISSQIVFKALEMRDQISEFSGMFQKEVAQRICSKEDEHPYSFSTYNCKHFTWNVLTQLVCPSDLVAFANTRWGHTMTKLKDDRVLIYGGQSFDLEGNLKGTPYMDDVQGFDKTTHGLKKYRSETMGGFVYVNIDGTAEPLAPQISELTEWMENWETEKAELFNFDYELNYECDFNWVRMCEQNQSSERSAIV